jgi:hypothetical protein
MLALLGPTHPLYDSLSHSCLGHERKNSFTSRLPEFQEFWTAHPRDRVFGSRIDAFFTHEDTGINKTINRAELAGSLLL